MESINRMPDSCDVFILFCPIIQSLSLFCFCCLIVPFDQSCFQPSHILPCHGYNANLQYRLTRISGICAFLPLCIIFLILFCKPHNICTTLFLPDASGDKYGSVQLVQLESCPIAISICLPLLMIKKMSCLFLWKFLTYNHLQELCYSS